MALRCRSRPQGPTSLRCCLLVPDSNNHRVQVFNVDTGALVRTIGTTGQAGAAPGPLNYPSGVAIHPGADGATLLFVTEAGNNRVQVFAL